MMRNTSAIVLFVILFVSFISAKKIIAVIGGSGGQGGAVVNAILSDPQNEFHCRVITRNPNSEKAQKIVQRGCEVVHGDLDDVESLKKAFEGAYGVFGVTNYWEIFDVDREIKQGKNIADAAKATGISHTIWSTLDSAKDAVVASGETSFHPQGDWIVPHMDGKSEISKYFRQLGIPFTDFFTSYFLENVLSGISISLLPSGDWAFIMNMKDEKLPVVAVEDIGNSVVAIFKNKDQYLNKEFYVVNDVLKVDKLAEKFSQHLGKKVSYAPLPYEEAFSAEYPGATDIANMFHYKSTFPEIFAGKRNVEECKKLLPNLLSIDDWIIKHKSEILSFMKQKEDTNKQKADL